jgi:cytochrome c5
MAKKNHTLKVWIILGISVALMLFIFILVAHHRSTADRIRLDRSALLSSAATVAERIKPVGQISIHAAETKPEPVKAAVATPPPSRNGQQVYQASCVACHGAGIAGAPKMEDKAQWATRIAKGLETLYANAVNGVQGSAGVMPAKGGNPALSNAEVKAAVDYMLTQSK